MVIGSEGHPQYAGHGADSAQTLAGAPESRETTRPALGEEQAKSLDALPYTVGASHIGPGWVERSHRYQLARMEIVTGRVAGYGVPLR